jgi:hypothetical protein
MKSGETKSPLDLSTPNIVMMTLKISFPFPVSACAWFVAISDTNANDER